jgi:methyl-accepting chemotaxis protein
MATHPIITRQARSSRISSKSVGVQVRSGNGVTKRGEDQLQKEILRLVEAAREGRLSERGRVQRFQGKDRKLLEGVNSILDTIVAPLRLAADYVEQFSRGAIPQKITTDYKGDFNTLKNNVNACIDSLDGLVEADAVLQKMAVNDYSAMVAEKYLGAFATVAQSVNLVHRRVTHLTGTITNIAQGDLRELAEYKKIGRRSDGEHQGTCR